MNRILLACTSALAISAASAADATTVRLSGNIDGTNAPFTLTYKSSQVTDSITPWWGSFSTLTGRPDIVIGGSKVIEPNYVDTHNRIITSMGSLPEGGFVEDWSHISDFGYDSGCDNTGIGNCVGVIARDGLGSGYLYGDHHLGTGLYVDITRYDAEYNYYDGYQADYTTSFGFSIDDGAGDPDFLSQHITTKQFGNNYVFELKNLGVRTDDFFNGWEPKFKYIATDFDRPTVTYVGTISRVEIGDLSMTGSTADWPVLPTNNTPGGGFGFTQPVLPNVPVFFDPPVSVGYDYSIADGNPLITKAMFPALLGDLDGFDIYALGGDSLLFADVMGGQWVDFTTLAGFANGISGFSLRGINPALELDPTNPTAFVTGLTFATAGTVNLTQTPVTIEWPIPGGGGGGTGAVPEPASWAMLIAGFGLTGAVMRRRRARAFA